MTNLNESDNFDSGVYQIQTTDAAIGGPGGIANMPGQNLANRTRWLFNRLSALLNGTARYATTNSPANAYALNYSPAVSALVDGQIFSFYASNNNTGASTFTPCDGTVSGTTAIAPLPILGIDGTALTGGEIVGQCAVRYSSGANNGSGAFTLISNIQGYQRAVTPPNGDNSSKVPNTNWIASLFAKIGGSPSQTFNVATASQPNHALPLGQAESDFAALNGSVSEKFSAAKGAAGTDVVNVEQVVGVRSDGVCTSTNGTSLTATTVEWTAPSNGVYAIFAFASMSNNPFSSPSITLSSTMGAVSPGWNNGVQAIGYVTAKAGNKGTFSAAFTNNSANYIFLSLFVTFTPDLS